MKILFTSVCNDQYAVGAQVMLYSMMTNIRGFDNCDVKFVITVGIFVVNGIPQIPKVIRLDRIPTLWTGLVTDHQTSLSK